MKDSVVISDQLELFGGSQHRISPPLIDKEIVKIEGFFSAVCRERGKLVFGTRREGKNIWTLTGREYLALLMSYSAYGTSAHNSGNANPDTPYRDDRIRYIGFGTGSYSEVASVSQLQSPIAYTSGVFLAQVSLPTFPLSPTLSTVNYSRSFAETELSVSGTVNLTEAGLFTDGAPPNYVPLTRDTTFVNSASQAPAAYKTFEVLKKTQNFTLEVNWQIRF